MLLALPVTTSQRYRPSPMVRMIDEKYSLVSLPASQLFSLEVKLSKTIVVHWDRSSRSSSGTTTDVLQCGQLTTDALPFGLIGAPQDGHWNDWVIKASFRGSFRDRHQRVHGTCITPAVHVWRGHAQCIEHAADLLAMLGGMIDDLYYDGPGIHKIPIPRLNFWPKGLFFSGRQQEQPFRAHPL